MKDWLIDNNTYELHGVSIFYLDTDRMEYIATNLEEKAAEDLVQAHNTETDYWYQRYRAAHELLVRIHQLVDPEYDGELPF